MLDNFLYWISTIVIWYFALLLLSTLTMPLGALIFQKFKDRGYALYRALGLMISGYLLFVLSRIGLLSMNAISVYSVLTVCLFLSVFLKRKFKPHYPSLRTIITTEIVFFILLTSYLYIKGFDPSIRSLEKFMDFGFIQSIINSKTVPPQDPWFASTTKNYFPINYYYFGHFLTAFLTTVSGLRASVTYNLMLGTIFALGMTMSFSISYNLYHLIVPHTKRLARLGGILAGLLGMYLTNLAGNLHTIYIFTKGYNGENPIPFWNIWQWFNPGSYWYPNATRFIPYTIHEFPSYSYVVSDLHGHVLDIPFTILMLALFLILVLQTKRRSVYLISTVISVTLATAYMTSSSDFLVYSALLFFILIVLHKTFIPAIKHFVPIVAGALVLTVPFSISFKPFATGIGLNCAPDFLVKLQKIGPLMFEADKCQTSPFWMLAVLWGFFWINFLGFLFFVFFRKKAHDSKVHISIFYFIFFCFVISILLTLFAEFFYFKDIYPAHFRANTMFKLGYQAFIIMSILSGALISVIFTSRPFVTLGKAAYGLILFPALILVCVYPFYSFPSYFGDKGFKTLDGSYWIKESYAPIYDMINLLNEKKLKTSRADFSILEAHGDSYTDYNLVSAHTGLSTVVGWPVHEWLWRGTFDVVAPRAEEVRFMYEGDVGEMKKLKQLLKKYRIRYVVIAQMERQKYPSLSIDKWYTIGKSIYRKDNNYLFEIYAQ